MTQADSTTIPTTASDAALDHFARGKVLKTMADGVVFQPRATTYEMHLRSPDFNGQVGEMIHAVIRVKARKIYTVPSGGNFVAPIMGSPRIFQGRVLDILDGVDGSPQRLVIKAGVIVVVELPGEAHAIDLGSGDIQAGAIVNVVAEPGTRVEAVDE